MIPVLVALAPPESGTIAAEPSAAYKASLRRTAELRKERRRAAATTATAPVGVIVAYPMPPALLIRQTREAHDEIEQLLRLLRSSK
jgi:hypothetical protein